MCLFSIKFEGRRYNKAAALRLLKNQKQDVEVFVRQLNESTDAYRKLEEKYDRERQLRHKAECDLGAFRKRVRELEAQLSTANEELNDFPARAKSGKYVKRRKTAKPEVKPTNAE